MDVEQVEQQAHRALGAWAAASATAGAGLWLAAYIAGQPVQRAFGGQNLLWGALNGAQSILITTTPSGAPAATVRYLHLATAGVNLGVIAAGLVLTARPYSAPRWLRWPDRSGEQLRGHGLAFIVQGAALFAIDATAARRLRAVDLAEPGL